LRPESFRSKWPECVVKGTATGSAPRKLKVRARQTEDHMEKLAAKRDRNKTCGTLANTLAECGVAQCRAVPRPVSVTGAELSLRAHC
jgi:hypothetical protein